MRPFFVSYRRDPWLKEVTDLARACHRRGVQTILDVSDPGALAGSAQLDAIRTQIRDGSSGLILYFSRNITGSAVVWKVEVPAALDAVDRGNYVLMPVFRDLRPSDALSVLPHGPRLAAMAGVVVQSEIGAAHAEVGRQALAAVLRLHNAEQSGEPLRVALRTRDTGAAVEADLYIDWTADFDLLLRGDASPAPAVIEALQDVCKALKKNGVRDVHLTGGAHLSAAIAFGYVCNRAAGYRLWVAQRDAIWAADGPVGDASIRVSAQQLSASGSDVALVLAISRPEAVADADAATANLGLPLSGRIVVQPVNGPGRWSVADEAQARGIVNAIVTALMSKRAEWRAKGVVHVFIAGPFALAALLGHSLNSFGPLQLYEKRPSGDGYVPTLTLA